MGSRSVDCLYKQGYWNLKTRYFFHVSDGIRPIIDDQGTLISGPDGAISQASVIAAELAQNGRCYQGYIICVVDDQGKEIGEVPVLSNSIAGDELLTQREKSVLARVVQGSSSKEIAQSLKISSRTVEFHRANIMQKLGARNVAELIRIALR
jgi:DNA-binding CsgD family transcriptional regulator